MSHFYLGNDIFIPTEKITVKQIQSRLKIALNKISVVNYNEKIGYNHIEIGDVTTVRKQKKNVSWSEKSIWLGTKQKQQKKIIIIIISQQSRILGTFLIQRFQDYQKDNIFY